jgi:peptidoglycan hydrolase-like protein with peptidoglycan-binding domain
LPARRLWAIVGTADSNYLRSGIDGQFGEGTERAVRALQYDRCAAESRVDMGPRTPLHPATTETFRPTRYHPDTTYTAVPDRTKLGCDWPYALRRYNGGGVNSYHYQYEALQRLTRPPLAP